MLPWLFFFIFLCIGCFGEEEEEEGGGGRGVLVIGWKAYSPYSKVMPLSLVAFPIKIKLHKAI